MLPGRSATRLQSAARASASFGRQSLCAATPHTSHAWGTAASAGRAGRRGACASRPRCGHAPAQAPPQPPGARDRCSTFATAAATRCWTPCACGRRGGPASASRRRARSRGASVGSGEAGDGTPNARAPGQACIAAAPLVRAGREQGRTLFHVGRHRGGQRLVTAARALRAQTAAVRARADAAGRPQLLRCERNAAHRAKDQADDEHQRQRAGDPGTHKRAHLAHSYSLGLLGESAPRATRHAPRAETHLQQPRRGPCEGLVEGERRRRGLHGGKRVFALRSARRQSAQTRADASHAARCCGTCGRRREDGAPASAAVRRTSSRTHAALANFKASLPPR